MVGTEMSDSPLTWANFRTQAMSLYFQQQYADSLAYIEQHSSQFPQEAGSIENWRMCMYALTGQPERALQVFRQAVERGIWWSAGMLLGDTDLDSIKNRSDFRQLVEVCEQQHAEALKNSRPTRLVLEPENPACFAPLIIAMHGHGGNLHSNEEEWRHATQPGWRVVLLGSSQIISTGRYAWNDFELAAREVRQHFDELTREYAVDTDRVVLGGFSQSGWLVCDLAMRQVLPCAGFISVCPYVPLDVDLDKRLSLPALKTLRAVVVGGENDRLLPSAVRMDEFLTRAETRHEYLFAQGIAHEFPRDFGQRLPGWLGLLTS